MRLEKKLEQELQQRKGLTGRTIVQIVWLIISGVIAYFLLGFLEGQGAFTYDEIYQMVAIPRAVPQWAVMGGLILLIVMVMQVAMLIGYVFASPEGRRRTGEPSLHSHKKDPFDSNHY